MFLTAIMSTSSTASTFPRISKPRPMDGEQLIRFVRSSSHLIKGVLDKVHRGPRSSSRLTKRKTDRQRKNRHCKNDCLIASPTNVDQQTAYHPVNETQMNNSQLSTNAVDKQTTFSVPLEYFAQNEYAEDELSVDHLSPSLTSAYFTNSSDESCLQQSYTCLPDFYSESALSQTVSYTISLVT